MTKVLLATQKPFAEKAISKIQSVLNEAGYQVETLENYTSQEQLCMAMKDVDGVIVRSDIIDRQVIECASKLKVIVRAGSGYDNVDLDAASARNMVVMNTPGQNANAVAELAIGLAIYAVRSLFSGASGGELRGRTLGLHGYGYVARNVNRIARGFGMNVIVYTRYSKTQAISEGIMVTDSLEELYAMSDIVSIHVPARGEHIESVSYEILRHLKKCAVIINTARKEVVNEVDMIRFMHQRPDVKYLSDVAPDRLKEFENTLQGRFYFTPKKIGAQTAEANLNAGVAAAEQIVAFFEKDDHTFQVNKPRK